MRRFPSSLSVAAQPTRDSDWESDGPHHMRDATFSQFTQRGGAADARQ
ncbi:MAG: hypothetical protein AAFY52_01970 [Pseudomonadota bacterium]